MRLLLGLIAILVIAFHSFQLQAARIRVSQESRPDAGDFDENVLGTIESADTEGVSAAEFYSYSEEYYYSFGRNGPRLRADTSQIFVVSAQEGLTLFVVHDRPDDEDGGAAVLRLKLEGDPDGASILVFDDPFSDWDSYETQLDQTLFITRHRWFPCCTDGLVLGTLEGSWRLFIEFPREDDFYGSETIQGMKFWTVLSAGGSAIPLAMEKGRRVRLDPVRALAKKHLPRLRNSDKGRVKDLKLRQLTRDPTS